MSEINDHLYSEAKFVASPNFDDRPEGEISLLVVHNISLPPGEFGGPYIEQLFTNQINPSDHPFFEEIKDLKVASHLLIRRKGEVIQFVPFDKRAWHAGQSEFEGRTACNDFSIGIELEGTDDKEFTEEQYESLAQVTAAIFKAYPDINKKRVTGHSDIAPGRKTDPGPQFDWQYYFSSLNHYF